MIYNVLFLMMFLAVASAIVRIPMAKIDDKEFVASMKARIAAGRR